MDDTTPYELNIHVEDCNGETLCRVDITFDHRQNALTAFDVATRSLANFFMARAETERLHKAARAEADSIREARQAQPEAFNL